jgi:hypothetical protein
MQPEIQPLSSDYLNQIATPQPKKTLNPFVLWGLIGGVLLLVVVVILAVSSAGQGSTSGSLTAVATKLSKLQKLSEKAQSNIQSSDLRSLNGSLTLVLTSANHDIAGPLKTNKISITNAKNPTVKKVNDYFASLDARLEDARLNAVYDRTYARELSYALKTLESDISILRTSTHSRSLKAVLATTNNNLTPIAQSLQDFNGS